VHILKIDVLTPQRITEIVALDRICLGGLWTENGYRREIDSPNSSLLILDLFDGKSSSSDGIMVGIGCLWSIAEEAHITLLAVHPDHRRQGLGQLLLLTLLKDAIARKLAWATLEVNVNNRTAIALYQKFGFEVAGKRKGYYQATGEDAVILWLKGIQRSDFQLNILQWRKNIEESLGNTGYCWHKS